MWPCPMAAQEAIWLIQFLHEVNERTDDSILIHGDNESPIC